MSESQIAQVPATAPDPEKQTKRETTIVTIEQAVQLLIKERPSILQKLFHLQTCHACGNWVNPSHPNVEALTLLPIINDPAAPQVEFRCGRCRHRRSIHMA